MSASGFKHYFKSVKTVNTIAHYDFICVRKRIIANICYIYLNILI